MREQALTESKFFGDGREAVVYPLTFGRARIVVGPAHSPFLDDGW